MEIYSDLGLVVALCVGSAIDLHARRLPDWLTLPLIAAGLGYAVLDGLGAGLWSLVGAILGFLSLYLVSRLYLHLRHQHGLGLGDAKLLAAAGAWLGPLYLAPVVFLGAILALLFVLCLRVAGRAVSWQMTLPFGPFLSAGFFICWCIKLGGWSLVL
jgi:leader peptidase (prepilin peptidase)/N-methyltransferase